MTPERCGDAATAKRSEPAATVRRCGCDRNLMASSAADAWAALLQHRERSPSLAVEGTTHELPSVHRGRDARPREPQRRKPRAQPPAKRRTILEDRLTSV